MQGQDGEGFPQVLHFGTSPCTHYTLHTAHCTIHIAQLTRYVAALTAGKGGGEGQVAADHVLHADGVLCKDTRGKRRSCGKVQLATSACKLHADHGLCTLNTPQNGQVAAQLHCDWAALQASSAFAEAHLGKHALVAVVAGAAGELQGQ